MPGQVSRGRGLFRSGQEGVDISIRLLRYYRFPETEIGVPWLGMTATGAFSLGVPTSTWRGFMGDI